MTSIGNYILELSIKEGAIECPFRPVLMVETAVDGVVNEANKTGVAKTSEGRAVWNKCMTLGFATLEPVTPVIVSMSMLRKRMLHQGFKLVGTARFSISELIPILNKGPIQRSIKIVMIKGIPVSGSITITLNLKSKYLQHMEEAVTTDASVPANSSPRSSSAINKPCHQDPKSTQQRSIAGNDAESRVKTFVSLVSFNVLCFALLAAIACIATYQILV